MPYGEPWASDAIWRHTSGLTQLAQVMAPGNGTKQLAHYLSWCWVIISEVLWYSTDGNFTGNAQDIYPMSLKITNIRQGLTLSIWFTCPSGMWFWKFTCPAKIFTCPANICQNLVNLMYTTGKISTCPDWKITCPVRHVTTKVYVPWDKIYMPGARACG